IGIVYASGLGLPDRDYYVKTEPRFADAREKYKAHVERALALAQRPDPHGSAAAIFDFETALAKASLDNVALRDPYATDHPMSFEAMAKASPAIEFGAWYDEAHVPRDNVNVDKPK